MKNFEHSDLPLIVSDWADEDAHVLLIESMLKNILSEEFFALGADDVRRRQLLTGHLPKCVYVRRQGQSLRVNLYLLAERRQGLFSYFSHMVGQWLVPGKQVQVVRSGAYDFTMPRIAGGEFTVMEAAVQLETGEDLLLMQQSIGTLLADIRLGASSAYCARQILELKGLTGEQKHARIQESLARMGRRWPERFGKGLFGAMQRFLSGASEEFVQRQSERQIVRLISYTHHVGRQLRDALAASPQTHHLHARVLPQEKGRRLGLFVGVTLRRDETMGQPHLFRSILHSIPGVREVEGSFVQQQRPYDPVHLLYMEVEQERPFTPEEIRRLKSSIQIDLRNRIEQQRHPIFMPRNDEEVMRHIVTLSEQLKLARDVPQVHLSFSEQTERDLVFTVVLVRVRKPGSPTLEELFRSSGSKLHMSPEFVKVVGSVRRKHPKEATVFRVSIPQERFFRSDYSVDLYRARQALVAELHAVLGDFRDYNGGLFSQQHRQLLRLRTALGGIGRRYELLLENFFHALHPHVMRCVLETETLRNFFLMVLGIAESGSRLKVYEDIHSTYVTLLADSPEGEQRVQDAVARLGFSETQLAHVAMEANDQKVLGFLLRDRSAEEGKRLLAALHEALLESSQLQVAQ